LNRLVQRRHQFGPDRLAARDYSYRQTWVRDRLKQLSGAMAIDVLDYAVLGNHHFPLYWNDPRRPRRGRCQDGSMGGTMTSFARGWTLQVDTGSEWMFLVLGRQPGEADLTPPLTDFAWQQATQHGLFRIVLELSPEVILSSHLVGQLVLLHRRVHQSGGVLRICKFSSNNYDVLVLMQLSDRFFNYRSREAAVTGHQ
jgi:hypothetical protein